MVPPLLARIPSTKPAKRKASSPQLDVSLAKRKREELVHLDENLPHLVRGQIRKSPLKMLFLFSEFKLLTWRKSSKVRLTMNEFTVSAASTPSDDLGSADPLGLAKLGTGTVEKDRRSKKKWDQPCSSHVIQASLKPSWVYLQVIQSGVGNRASAGLFLYSRSHSCQIKKKLYYKT